MQDKCPICDEPLIIKTIKKELALGSVDYPIAQVCPKGHWSRDLTGAGDIVSKPLAAKEEPKPKPKPVPEAPKMPKPMPAAKPLDFNKIITIVLALLVIGGLVWAFYPAAKKLEKGATPTPTPTVTQAPIQAPTPTPEITPTGNKTRILLDSNRGFIPNTKTIKLGDEIVWRNNEKITVTLVSSESPRLFDEQILAYDKEYRYIFKKTGTYTFYLKENTSLKGTIIVES